MDSINQTKQVFVDESGRRGRLLTAAMRAGCVMVVVYLSLLVAGFLGASWVPSVRLPIVGDIFDVGQTESLAPVAAAPDHRSRDAIETSDHNVGAPAQAAERDMDTADANQSNTEEAAATSNGRGSSGSSRGNGAKPQPSPVSSPNHGTASGNPNAGPKPKKTPAPKPSRNHGSNGNSENAGPKPKPTRTPHGPGSLKNHEPEPSPSPGA